jgi:hypothetical protein
VAIRGFDEKRRGLKAGFFSMQVPWRYTVAGYPAPSQFGHAVSRRPHALMTLNVAAMPRHEYDEWR